MLPIDSELNTGDLNSNIKLLFEGTNNSYVKILKMKLLSRVNTNEVNKLWVYCICQYFYGIKQILLKYDYMCSFHYCGFYIGQIDIECILKCESPVTPEEYDLLLKKVELQLEKVPKILEQQEQLNVESDLYKLAKEILSSEFCKTDYETYKNKVEEFEQKLAEFNKIQTLQSEKAPEIRKQQKQLKFGSDLYQLADEILGEQIHNTDYEIYKNKVEEFEREFEKFSENQKLKNNGNQVDDGKESDENKIGNNDNGELLGNKDVAKERSDDNNSEYCLKNILWYRVFLYLSLFSLLLLIISVYYLIVTAIFLLASVVLYFIQKTKNDDDYIKSVGESLSPKMDQKQSKNLISSIDKNRDNNVKQQNEFSLFDQLK